jgi:hypothetical protein
VEQDPELRLDGYADAPLPNGDVFRAIDPSLAVWLAYSKHQPEGNQAWIGYWEGNVIVKTQIKKSAANYGNWPSNYRPESKGMRASSTVPMARS